jgi:hypothetical protein
VVKRKKRKKIEASDFGSTLLIKDEENNQLIRPVDGAKFHVVYPSNGQRHLHRIDDHILIVYRNRKLLNPINAESNTKRYLAGAIVRELGQRANIEERVTPNWDSFLVMIHGSKQNIAVDKIDSYEKLHQALKYAVKYNNVLWDCCIVDKKVGPKMNLLREGLDMLIEYFKIK